MPTLTGILLLFAFLAYVSARSRNRVESGESKPLKWWQKLAGGLALIAVVMIAINPEFLALGLLCDTAFFDLFVLLLSLQFQFGFAWAWRRVGGVLLKALRWTIAPSPRLSYFLIAWAFGVIASLVSAIHRVILRISS